MAKIKHLKKDIEMLTSELINECYMAHILFPKVEEKKIDAIIESALNMREEFLRRCNNVDGKNDAKLVKKHFSKLNEDLLTSYNGLADQVNDLAK